MPGKIVPPDWQEAFIAESWIGTRPCAVQTFIYTYGLLVDLTFDGPFNSYSARYCYPDPWEALDALLLWDGEGDPPGRWAKEKVSGRLGPALLEKRKSA